MRKLAIFILLFALIRANHVYGQGRDDGSLYSRYGIGELSFFASGQAQALGGASAALVSSGYLNFSNPATWSRQELVRVAVGAQFDQLHAQDALGRSEQFLRGNFNALQIGIPLLANRLGLGFFYQPYSRMHFKVSTTGTLQTLAEDDLPYQIDHEGSGGLHQMRVGLGLKLNSWASVGAAGDLLWGIIEEGRHTAFTNADLLETNLSTTTRLFGATFASGITFSFDDQDYELVLAANASLPVSLSGSRTITLGESLDLDTLGTSNEGEIELPYQLSGGLSFRYQDRWLISAEIRHEPWSSVSSTLPFTAFESDHLRDRIRYSAGVELTPAGASIQANYLSRTSYRIGFYRDQLYVSPVTDREVTVSAITGGLGLPTLFMGTRIDLSFEIGTRGSINYNLIRDRFIGVSATLNIGERWFVKRKLG